MKHERLLATIQQVKEQHTLGTQEALLFVRSFSWVQELQDKLRKNHALGTSLDPRTLLVIAEHLPFVIKADLAAESGFQPSLVNIAVGALGFPNRLKAESGNPRRLGFETGPLVVDLNLELFLKHLLSRPLLCLEGIASATLSIYEDLKDSGVRFLRPSSSMSWSTFSEAVEEAIALFFPSYDPKIDLTLDFLLERPSREISHLSDDEINRAAIEVEKELSRNIFSSACDSRMSGAEACTIYDLQTLYSRAEREYTLGRIWVEREIAVAYLMQNRLYPGDFSVERFLRGLNEETKLFRANLEKLRANRAPACIMEVTAKVISKKNYLRLALIKNRSWLEKFLSS